MQKKKQPNFTVAKLETNKRLAPLLDTSLLVSTTFSFSGLFNTLRISFYCRFRSIVKLQSLLCFVFVKFVGLRSADRVRLCVKPTNSEKVKTQTTPLSVFSASFTKGPTVSFTQKNQWTLCSWQQFIFQSFQRVSQSLGSLDAAVVQTWVGSGQAPTFST